MDPYEDIVNQAQQGRRLSELLNVEYAKRHGKKYQGLEYGYDPSNDEDFGPGGGMPIPGFGAGGGMPVPGFTQQLTPPPKLNLSSPTPVAPTPSSTATPGSRPMVPQMKWWEQGLMNAVNPFLGLAVPVAAQVASDIHHYNTSGKDGGAMTAREMAEGFLNPTSLQSKHVYGDSKAKNFFAGIAGSFEDYGELAARATGNDYQRTYDANNDDGIDLEYYGGYIAGNIAQAISGSKVFGLAAQGLSKVPYMSTALKGVDWALKPISKLLPASTQAERLTLALMQGTMGAKGNVLGYQRGEESLGEALAGTAVDALTGYASAGMFDVGSTARSVAGSLVKDAAVNTVGNLASAEVSGSGVFVNNNQVEAYQHLAQQALAGGDEERAKQYMKMADTAKTMSWAMLGVGTAIGTGMSAGTNLAQMRQNRTAPMPADTPVEAAAEAVLPTSQDLPTEVALPQSKGLPGTVAQVAQQTAPVMAAPHKKAQLEAELTQWAGGGDLEAYYNGADIPVTLKQGESINDNLAKYEGDAVDSESRAVLRAKAEVEIKSYANALVAKYQNSPQGLEGLARMLELGNETTPMPVDPEGVARAIETEWLRQPQNGKGIMAVENVLRQAGVETPLTAPPKPQGIAGEVMADATVVNPEALPQQPMLALPPRRMSEDVLAEAEAVMAPSPAKLAKTLHESVATPPGKILEELVSSVRGESDATTAKPKAQDQSGQEAPNQTSKIKDGTQEEPVSIARLVEVDKQLSAAVEAERASNGAQPAVELYQRIGNGYDAVVREMQTIEDAIAAGRQPKGKGYDGVQTLRQLVDDGEITTTLNKDQITTQFLEGVLGMPVREIKALANKSPLVLDGHGVAVLREGKGYRVVLDPAMQARVKRFEQRYGEVLGAVRERAPEAIDAREAWLRPGNLAETVAEMHRRLQVGEIDDAADFFAKGAAKNLPPDVQRTLMRGSLIDSIEDMYTVSSVKNEQMELEGLRSGDGELAAEVTSKYNAPGATGRKMQAKTVEKAYTQLDREAAGYGLADRDEYRTVLRAIGDAYPDVKAMVDDDPRLGPVRDQVLRAMQQDPELVSRLMDRDDDALWVRPDTPEEAMVRQSEDEYVQAVAGATTRPNDPDTELAAALLDDPQLAASSAEATRLAGEAEVQDSPVPTGDRPPSAELLSDAFGVGAALKMARLHPRLAGRVAANLGTVAVTEAYLMQFDDDEWVDGMSGRDYKNLWRGAVYGTLVSWQGARLLLGKLPAGNRLRGWGYGRAGNVSAEAEASFEANMQKKGAGKYIDDTRRPNPKFDQKLYDEAFGVWKNLKRLADYGATWATTIQSGRYLKNSLLENLHTIQGKVEAEAKMMFDAVMQRHAAWDSKWDATPDVDPATGVNRGPIGPKIRRAWYELDRQGSEIYSRSTDESDKVRQAAMDQAWAKMYEKMSPLEVKAMSDWIENVQRPMHQGHWERVAQIMVKEPIEMMRRKYEPRKHEIAALDKAIASVEASARELEASGQNAEARTLRKTASGYVMQRHLARQANTVLDQIPQRVNQSIHRGYLKHWTEGGDWEVSINPRGRTEAEKNRKQILANESVMQLMPDEAPRLMAENERLRAEAQTLKDTDTRKLFPTKRAAKKYVRSLDDRFGVIIQRRQQEAIDPNQMATGLDAFMKLESGAFTTKFTEDELKSVVELMRKGILSDHDEAISGEALDAANALLASVTRNQLSVIEAAHQLKSLLRQGLPEMKGRMGTHGWEVDNPNDPKQVRAFLESSAHSIAQTMANRHVRTQMDIAVNEAMAYLVDNNLDGKSLDGGRSMFSVLAGLKEQINVAPTQQASAMTKGARASRAAKGILSATTLNIITNLKSPIKNVLYGIPIQGFTAMMNRAGRADVDVLRQRYAQLASEGVYEGPLATSVSRTRGGGKGLSADPMDGYALAAEKRLAAEGNTREVLGEQRYRQMLEVQTRDNAARGAQVTSEIGSRTAIDKFLGALRMTGSYAKELGLTPLAWAFNAHITPMRAEIYKAFINQHRGSAQIAQVARRHKGKVGQAIGEIFAPSRSQEPSFNLSSSSVTDEYHPDLGVFGSKTLTDLADLTAVGMVQTEAWANSHMVMYAAEEILKKMGIRNREFMSMTPDKRRTLLHSIAGEVANFRAEALGRFGPANRTRPEYKAQAGAGAVLTTLITASMRAAEPAVWSAYNLVKAIKDPHARTVAAESAATLGASMLSTIMVAGSMGTVGLGTALWAADFMNDMTTGGDEGAVVKESMQEEMQRRFVEMTSWAAELLGKDFHPMTNKQDRLAAEKLYQQIRHGFLSELVNVDFADDDPLRGAASPMVVNIASNIASAVKKETTKGEGHPMGWLWGVGSAGVGTIMPGLNRWNQAFAQAEAGMQLDKFGNPTGLTLDQRTKQYLPTPYNMGDALLEGTLGKRFEAAKAGRTHWEGGTQPHDDQQKHDYMMKITSLPGMKVGGSPKAEEAWSVKLLQDADQFRHNVLQNYARMGPQLVAEMNALNRWIETPEMKMAIARAADLGSQRDGRTNYDAQAIKRDMQRAIVDYYQGAAAAAEMSRLGVPYRYHGVSDIYRQTPTIRDRQGDLAPSPGLGLAYRAFAERMDKAARIEALQRQYNP